MKSSWLGSACLCVAGLAGCASTDGLSDGMRFADDFDEGTALDSRVWAVAAENTDMPKVVPVEGSSSAPNALEVSVPAMKAGAIGRSTIRTSMRSARVEVSAFVRLETNGAFEGERWNYVALAVLTGGSASIWLYQYRGGVSLASCDLDGTNCTEKDVDVDLKQWTRIDITARFGPEGRANLSINGIEVARLAVDVPTPQKTSIQLGLEGMAHDGASPAAKAWFDDVVLR